MKLFPLLLSCIVGVTITWSCLTNAQTPIMQQSLNMIAYEHKAPKQYAVVSYMPYYPAYGMISLKSPQCNAEIAGYVDPFELKKQKLIITYKLCKVSFDITANNEKLINPTETTQCQEYHPKKCNFTQVSSLQRVSLGNNL